MKTLLISVLLLMPVSLRPQNSGASIEGIVVDRVTSEGITGASLLLSGIVEDRVISLTAKTTAGGRFVFTNVRPSSIYWLTAAHGDSHVQTLYEQRGFYGTGTPLAVIAGQSIKDLRIAMVPTGSISGRVVDSSGKPVSDAQVVAMQSEYREGVRVLQTTEGALRTNRRGEYRVTGLTPGPYYLRVLINDPRGVSYVLMDRHLPGQSMASIARLTETEVYPFIYYPGVIDEVSAEAVNVPAGRPAEGTDIRVSRVHTRRIRGTIIDQASGLPIGSAELMVFKQNADRGSLPSLTVPTSDGRFDLRSILPGNYWLVAVVRRDSVALRGRVVLQVGNADLNDVRVPVNSGFGLSGMLSAPTPLPADVQVTLRPEAPSTTGLLPPVAFDQPVTITIPSMAGLAVESRVLRILEIPPASGVLSDSVVTFRAIAPWDYRVEVSGLPDGTYIKSIRMGSRDLLEEGLRIDGPVQEGLAIVIGSPASHIEGRVLDSAQRPLAALRVVLIPEKQKRNRPDLYRNALSDREGRFAFQNLAPGDYKVFAWEFADKESWLDPNFLRLYEDKGTALHLDEDSHAHLEVHALPPWF